LDASEAMKIVQTISWKSLHKCPEYFAGFLTSDRFKRVFDDPGRSKRIRTSEWPGYAGGHEFYAYYLWSEDGKLFGIISVSPHIEPRKGWMACAFDINHPNPETLNIFQAMMAADPAGVKHWSQHFQTKKELIRALETDSISWQREDCEEKHPID
jgi:hypothetical protein